MSLIQTLDNQENIKNVDVLIDHHLESGAKATMHYRRRPDEAVLYYFRDYSMRVEHIFGLDDLSWAAIRGDRGDIAEALRGGADINRPVRSGLTPLQLAAKRRHKSCVQALIAQGATVDARALKGMGNHMRDVVLRCVLNRSVIQHYRMAMVLLHNPESPFRVFDIEGLLVMVFHELMPDPLPRGLLVPLLKIVIERQSPHLKHVVERVQAQQVEIGKRQL